jgi:hypothetical protein
MAVGLSADCCQPDILGPVGFAWWSRAGLPTLTMAPGRLAALIATERAIFRIGIERLVADQGHGIDTIDRRLRTREIVSLSRASLLRRGCLRPRRARGF